MNVTCQDDDGCPVLLNAECVFYEGAALPDTGINTNDDLQTVIEKLNTAIAAGGGGGVWGSITGTITDQTDLITYLSTNYTPVSRTLTINGTALDLSANRSWSVGVVTSISAGTGISVGGTAAIPVITNTAPDQTVVLNNGTGINITGTYPNFTINATGGSSVGANNEVQTSDGAGGFVASNLFFNETTGAMDLGDLGLSGSTRVISAVGSASTVSLWLASQGNGEIRLSAAGNGPIVIVSAGTGITSITGGGPHIIDHAGGASLTTVNYALTLASTPAGSPSVGVGTGLQFRSQTASSNSEIGATIDAVTTDITASSEDFDLIFKTMSAGATAAERLRITSDGRIYGTALHNNAGAVTGATNQYIASGTYTPTLTGGVNVAGTGAASGEWIRVGNMVTVCGRVTFTATAAANTLTRLGISLPIASNFANIDECNGAATGNLTPGGAAWVEADSTNNRMELVWYAYTTSTIDMIFTATYLII